MATSRPRVAFVLAVAALVVALAACGDPTAGASGGSPDPDTPVSNTPGVDDPDPGAGAQRVTPRPGMADVHPVAWRRAVAIDGGESVRLRYYSGVEPCNVLDRIELVETDRTVTITLYEGYDPENQDEACIELAQLKEVVVELEAPVGDRRVIDGARAEAE